MCQTLRTTQQMDLEIVLQGRIKLAVQVLFYQLAIGYTLAIHCLPQHNSFPLLCGY
jgi:hypothetical protein